MALADSYLAGISAAGNPGVITVYELGVGIPVNMDEALYMLDPDDVPLLAGIGGDGVPTIGTGEALDAIEFNWLDDNYLLPRSLLGGAATTGDTSILVQSGHQKRFATGDIVRVVKAGTASETMLVTGYSATTADTIVVSRALVGTATNYSSGATIIVTGSALSEGSDPEKGRANDRIENENNTQIFGPTAVQMSRTETQIRKYGVPNEYNHQLMKRMREQWISAEQALLLGLRYNNTAARKRTTGGLDYFITTNVDTTNTQFNLTNITTLQKTNYNAGGVPAVAVINPISLNDINDPANTTILQQEVDDPMRGRRRVSYVVTEFGNLYIARHRWMPTSHAFFIEPGRVKARYLQRMVYVKGAVTGDSVSGFIVMELGFEVKGEEHMAKMTALSYS